MLKEKILFFILSLALPVLSATAQRVVVSGTVTDSITGETLPYATVRWQGTAIGVQTDADGHFTFASSGRYRTLEVTYVGYDTLRYVLPAGPARGLDLRLRPSSVALAEVEVRPRREHYKRRGNPAVAFVRKVIARRDAHDPREVHDYYSYERYQRMVFALDEYAPKPRKEGGKPGRFDFVREFADTLDTGTPVLPVSERERLERVFCRRHPKSEKTLLMGSKAAGVDEVFSREGIQQFLNEAFREVDIFQNNIPLFLQRFVSPLSTLGPAFYKYYLLDTVQVAGRSCMDLGFVPFNSESFGFTGHLYVTLDSTYFVRRAVLNVAKDINLNFVSRMTIEQEFERTADSTRLITKDDIRVNFKLTEKSKGMYAQRLNVYRAHSFDPPAAEHAALFEQPAPLVEQKGAYRRQDDFWAENRPEEARKKNPNGVDKLMKRLRSVPIFYFTEKVVTTLVSGYIPTNKNPEKNKFDLGPMNSTINGNSMEGVRLRVGGGTTPNFHKHWFFEGYAAYGTKDRKMKYDGLVEYSFTPRKDFRLEYPQHSLRLEYMYDLNKLGQNYMYTSKDNVMLAIKRKKDNVATYLRRAELTYTREHYNGFSYAAVVRNLREYATPYAPFNRIGADGALTPADHYDLTALELKLRYGYGEKFYQTRTQRIPITYDAFIFNLSHTMARKGFLGSSYDLQRTEVGMQKRFWFSAFGYLDAIVKVGKVWTKVPYPLLILPNANTTYTIQPETYTNMNALEFINDEYLSWDLTYYMNGILLNRIPLLKKLRWREVFCFRGLWGHLTDKNDPAKQGEGLYAFPEATQRLGRAPYMEASVGVENIFNFLRLDYVWRLNYRGNPDIQRHGVRATMKLSF